jgi:hypothetical protein
MRAHFAICPNRPAASDCVHRRGRTPKVKRGRPSGPQMKCGWVAEPDSRRVDARAFHRLAEAAVVLKLRSSPLGKKREAHPISRPQQGSRPGARNAEKGHAFSIARTHTPRSPPAIDPRASWREGNLGFHSKPGVKWNSSRTPRPNTGCSMTPTLRLAPLTSRSVGAASRMLTLRRTTARFCLSVVIVCCRKCRSQVRVRKFQQDPTFNLIGHPRGPQMKCGWDENSANALGRRLLCERYGHRVCGQHGSIAGSKPQYLSRRPAHARSESGSASIL